MVEISERQWIKVRTTVPLESFPPIESRSAVRTERLLLRPFTQNDLESLHVLRLQPEVMVWTMQGRPDKDLEETQKNLDIRLEGNQANNYDWAICVAETGQLIGIGGCMRTNGDLGWPVVGYMLLKEQWGKGYGTEFVKGFLKVWWELPRREAEIEVDRHTVADPAGIVPECLVAVTVEHNPASQNVLRKSGMKLVKRWEEEDAASPGGQVLLHAYAAFKPVQDD
ncbi:putative GMP synthase [Paramyrothecium foliicola]|nr:putative GMP synthase [Paramyrothecium foliicola]